MDGVGRTSMIKHPNGFAETNTLLEYAVLPEVVLALSSGLGCQRKDHTLLPFVSVARPRLIPLLSPHDFTGQLVIGGSSLLICSPF